MSLGVTKLVLLHHAAVVVVCVFAEADVGEEENLVAEGVFEEA
jgi:hypothetical protein